LQLTRLIGLRHDFTGGRFKGLSFVQLALYTSFSSSTVIYIVDQNRVPLILHISFV